MKKSAIQVGAVLVVLALPHIASATNMNPDKPNIVVIMADDMGYADTGFTGATDIQTPNLNELAASGVTFSSGYVTHPYCGPRCA
ncbi:sulfatase-like hydrolase/transferase [Novipirellula artificiosorum]|uniref:Arylsulfatase n=1 Tax=Novipirellula artificiosorum TaxID=2528016 RepID=A0A5C6DGR8_9BACT|nr:sulfatase-like hydrolase/transferase [Novipirellula artificiosorum]TWU34276.1 Arylsulfatase precursor [Novipirellula artificiosorum]